MSKKLTKAPRFEIMPRLRKEGNLLFEIYVRIDFRGFSWVNLDADDKSSIPSAQDFDATDKEFEEVDKFFKQVESEDKALCNTAQKNLNSGIYITGDLYSFNEKGVLYFPQYLKKILNTCYEKEEHEGYKIWPVQQRVIRNRLDKEIKFYEGLACGADGKKIEW